MPVIRFNNWASQGRSPLTRGQRLVTYETGAEQISSGITRFEPGAKIPLHYHNVEEQVTIIEGEAVAIIDGERVELRAYDTTYVPAGTPHHFMNESSAPMAILYIYPAPYVERHLVETGTMDWHGKKPEGQ
jgi:quercetin dioxygenase-like cupin family protein